MKKNLKKINTMTNILIYGRMNLKTLLILIPTSKKKNTNKKFNNLLYLRKYKIII